MPTQTIYHEIVFGTVPYAGRGDADVNTKGGRTTRVQLRVTGMKLSADRKIIEGHVLYQIDEIASDYTSLALSRKIWFPVPNHLAVTAIRSANDYTKDWLVLGKVHNEILLQPLDTNYCVSSARCKIDGGGRDDQGNAYLVLVLGIDLELA